MPVGCRGKPALKKHRMNHPLSSFAGRLRAEIARPPAAPSLPPFPELALELFALQFQHNAAYRRICEARGVTPSGVFHWTQIPAVPAAAFKELELTSLAPEERTAVFHSSGTTGQTPGRHFHGAESLALYEASLWSGFESNVTEDSGAGLGASRLLILSPPPAQVPHSSLVHMFETVRRKRGGASLPARPPEYFGNTTAAGVWTLDFEAIVEALSEKADGASSPPWLLLGTAFSFVHLVDHLAEKNRQFVLPAGSRVMETGGYKNRSRTMPKSQLHALLTDWLGVPPENILCEYGMSELSSQAYDTPGAHSARLFHFPPWARVQIVSPETGREVGVGEIGLVRVVDLANVFSVAAVQTEDLALRHPDGFSLMGRAPLAEPRGCSLLTI